VFRELLSVSAGKEFHSVASCCRHKRRLKSSVAIEGVK